MVTLKKPDSHPVPGKPFLIVASDGVGLYMFTIKIEGRVKTYVQKNPRLEINIPDDAQGEIIVKVMDNKKSMDTCILEVGCAAETHTPDEAQ